MLGDGGNAEQIIKLLWPYTGTVSFSLILVTSLCTSSESKIRGDLYSIFVTL